MKRFFVKSKWGIEIGRLVFILKIIPHPKIKYLVSFISFQVVFFNLVWFRFFPACSSTKRRVQFAMKTSEPLETIGMAIHPIHRDV